MTAAMPPPVTPQLTRTRLPLRVGTRGSPLALIQTRALHRPPDPVLPGLRDMDMFEEHAIRTTGDAVQNRRLAEIGGKGLFAKEIHEALADRRIDFAVHSLKDLETELPPGIVLACTLTREDARDALDLQRSTRRRRSRRPVRLPAFRRADRHRLDSPPGAVAARAPGSRHHHAARQCADAARQAGRGRLRCLGARLCRPEAARPGRACEVVLDPDAMVPAAGQGIVGVTVREDDTELRELLAAIEDPEAKAVSTAERAMLMRLDGSCRTPIGGHARLLPNGELHLTGLVARGDGSFLLKRSLHGAGRRRGQDRQRTGRQPAGRQPVRHLCLTPLAAF